MKKPLIQKLGLLGLVSFLSYTAAMLIALAACGKTETPEPTETPLPAPAIQTAAPETVKRTRGGKRRVEGRVGQDRQGLRQR